MNRFVSSLSTVVSIVVIGLSILFLVVLGLFWGLSLKIPTTATTEIISSTCLDSIDVDFLFNNLPVESSHIEPKELTKAIRYNVNYFVSTLYEGPNSNYQAGELTIECGPLQTLSSALVLKDKVELMPLDLPFIHDDLLTQIDLAYRDEVFLGKFYFQIGDELFMYHYFNDPLLRGNIIIS